MWLQKDAAMQLTEDTASLLDVGASAGSRDALLEDGADLRSRCRVEEEENKVSTSDRVERRVGEAAATYQAWR